MDRDTHVDHLRAAGEALLAAHRADPTAPVASCPGWDRTKLLAHTGRALAWMRAQVETGTGERVRFGTVELPPEGEALPAWFEQIVESLADGLSKMDVADTWPTWAGPLPGSFYPRRAAQEAAMHRWDADPTPFDPDFAVDGVDEHLERFAPLAAAAGFDGRTGTIHLHATDVEGDAGEWLIHVTPEGIRFEHGHAKGDVALRGTASDLLLWIWNRVPVDDRFEVFGDTALLDLWPTAVTI
jgi:uncharacterized protein (TIGR03083 family)